MLKKEIKYGFTNKYKYIKNGIFTIQKTKNGFNHRLDYSVTQVFNFVPRLINDSSEKIEFKNIEKSKWLIAPTTSDLKQLGEMFRQIHMSNIKLPKNNLRERIKFYLNIIHEKKINIPEIENNWKNMNKLLGRMGRLNPVHNDLWFQNILKDDNKKIWIIDWEYATMGDKHFDLAFYIESQKLTKEEEEIFLKAYGSSDSYQAWIPEWMVQYKMFVHWITIMWAYAQPKMPFNLEWMKNRINELSKLNLK